jgi:hypothetical protein
MRYLFLLFSLCFALSAAQEGDINAMIDDIVNASPEARYEKMNAFKLKMRELNQAQRAEALETLRAKAYPGLEAGQTQRLQDAKARGTQNGGGMNQQLQMQQQQQMLHQQEQQQMAPMQQGPKHR